MSEHSLYDTLRLGPRELKQLLESLDALPRKAPAKSRRSTQRWGLTGRRCVLTVQNEGDEVRHFAARARNLSSGGLAVLHGGYLHVGSGCIVTMSDLTGKTHQMQARVARCRHLQRHLHDLGLAFSEKINPRDFIDFGDAHAFTREQVDVKDLKGTLLVVEDSRMFQKVIGAYFKGSGLEIIYAVDGEGGLVALDEHPDMVFVDYILPTYDGVEFIRRARNHGYSGAMVLLTIDNTPGLRQEAISAGANEMLSKPCSPEALHQAAAEYILSNDLALADAGKIHSNADPAVMTEEMIREYIVDINKKADAITAALVAKDVAGAREAMRRIRASAGGFGFEAISLAARSALKALDATMSVEESSLEIRRLVSACRRADLPRSEAA